MFFLLPLFSFALISIGILLGIGGISIPQIDLFISLCFACAMAASVFSVLRGKAILAGMIAFGLAAFCLSLHLWIMSGLSH